MNQSSPSSQQIAGQQLTELFSAGIQHLLTLGGQSTIDQTTNSNNNNPLANISIEELGRMVMEQMCKEVKISNTLSFKPPITLKQFKQLKMVILLL